MPALGNFTRLCCFAQGKETGTMLEGSVTILPGSQIEASRA